MNTFTKQKRARKIVRLLVDYQTFAALNIDTEKNIKLAIKARKLLDKVIAS